MDAKIIAVDFDGTLCENNWPEIGEPKKEVITYLKGRQAAGDKLILWTCRVEINRFFKEGEDDFIEIASCEYEMRRKMHQERLENLKKEQQNESK